MKFTSCLFFLLTIFIYGCNPERSDNQANILQCNSSSAKANNSLPKALNYKIVARYPHRPNAFSQGLVFHQGHIYESSGLYGQSSIAQIDLASGEVLNLTALDDQYFGEGLTLFGQQFIQLTWKSGQVMRYRADDLSPIGSNSKINGEGWGLTHDGQSLINSDGSATLHWRDPETLKILSSAQIRYANRPLKKINELEWVNGCILANIWLSDTIVVINPTTAQVDYTLDVSALAQPELRIDADHVTNGIAYRQDNGNLLVTGKNWHYLYELRLQLN